MNFNKIELNGFKSFADKTEIKFEQGVTCIVGPNGCGKSNVADSIRWVLGEQSAKSLRGGSMQDVIFSGTQTRKSLSYCEVSLVFDNSTKLFDLAYNEVVLTRKLYRSGESEYLINRQPCRLKDLVSLLHSVGIGKDGYSIIGQNKISEIMAAKPDERRAIFEEATGIAVFKAKKNEIERKLFNSKENIDRFSDIIGEVERQLAPLSKQAESARKYFLYAEELKMHEINSYLYKFDNAEHIKNKINARLKELSEELDNKAKELANLQTDYEKSFILLKSMDETLYNLQDNLRNREVEIEKRQGNSKVYFEKISFYKSEIQRNLQVVENFKTRIDDINLEKAQKEGQIVDFKNRIDFIVSELKKLENEVGEVLSEIEIYERLQEQNQSKIISSMESLSEYKSKSSSLSTEKDVISERQKEILDKVSEENNKKNSLVLDINNLEDEINKIHLRASEIKEEVNLTNEKIADINLELNNIESKLFNENNKYATLLANQRLLNGLKESYEGYNGFIKNLMRAAKDNALISKKIKGVVADIIKTEQIYEVAIETAIGGAMQNIITATPDDASYLITYLKNTNGGRITFLPVSSVKPRYEQNQTKVACKENGALGLANELVSYNNYYDGIVRYLLGNTLICDNIQNAVNISKKFNNAFKIVTLDGDIINPSGAMSGGSRKQDSSNLLSSERKLKQVEDDIAEQISLLENLKNEKLSKEKVKAEFGKKVELLAEEYQSLRQQNAESNATKEAKKVRLAETEKDILSFEENMDSITKRLSKIITEYNSASESGELIGKQKSGKIEEIEKSRVEYENLKIKRDKLFGKISELKVESSTLNANTANYQSDIERISLEKEEKLSNINYNLKEIESKKLTIDELKAMAEKVSLTQEEQAEVNAVREKVKNVNSEKIALNDKLTNLDIKKTEYSNEITRLTEKKYNEEIALSKVDTELSAMQERIWEEYQATYESSISLKVENYDISSSKSNISALKRQISALGNINYNAIEDFNLTNDRYTEMIKQKADLDKAHEDLEAILKDLREEMQKQFDKGFKDINDNFKKIFKELFGGGRAELQLDYFEVEDPLAAGIEIVAEPPGKKLQKLSLLSGGEQALTAIAILFSILKLRAMPFCVLDEIEAALDEANVERVALYLKKFSKETQFIVITHRKPTMELADALYGVTMEEKGVSKIVSVKLSDVEDQLEIAN